MMEWSFADQSKFLSKLGILYREIAGIFDEESEIIQIFIDKLYITVVHEVLEKINYQLGLNIPHSSLLWITYEIMRQLGEQKGLSVSETEKRLKALRRALEKIIEVEVLSIYYLIPCFMGEVTLSDSPLFVAELWVSDSSTLMTVITGKRIKSGEKHPLRVFKLIPLAKELHLMDLRLQILSKRGELSKWKEPKPVTGEYWERIEHPAKDFFELKWKKRLYKSVFHDNKDLLVPVPLSHLVDSSQIPDVHLRKLFKDHPDLKTNCFKGFLDKDKALIIAVNAAELEEIKKL